MGPGGVQSAADETAGVQTAAIAMAIGLKSSFIVSSLMK
ncbi:hypothetical protein RGAI101_3791 [Roseobacter sp. GAI101]|nr:hypothetical protein RGAI101_3791 [Roseobacter sp. GAI101]